MQVFHGVRPSQPPRPRVMHEVSAREGSREAFTGETTGWVSSCETGRIPRCRSSSLTRRQHPPRANGLRMEEPRAVGDSMHVETSSIRDWGAALRLENRRRRPQIPARGREKFPEWHQYQSFVLQPDTDWLYSSREDDAQP